VGVTHRKLNEQKEKNTDKHTMREFKKQRKTERERHIQERSGERGKIF
jgi:hypothetical protein